MSDSTLNENVFSRVADRILSWKRPLLVAHAKPDGDALGSLAAMRALLREHGAVPCAVLFDDIPNRYALFHRFDPMPILGCDVQESDLSDFDGVVVLDTCAYGQLTPIADWLRASDAPKVAVDHHTTRDELADDYLIDESAAANCLILHEWATALGWTITPQAAEAMFVGIAMDTGWFRHSNTDARVFTATADLLQRSVKPHEFHQELFMKETPARIALLGAALGTLELLYEDRLGVMTVSSEVMSRCGATPADTEDIVNEPLRIESVMASVLLVEQGDGLIRCSFRSKPPDLQPSPLSKGGPSGVGELRPKTPQRKPSPLTKGGLKGDASSEPHPSACGTDETPETPQPPTSPLTKGGLRGVSDINIAAIAQSFGGGGHARAAGARIKGTLAEARQQIIDHFESICNK